MRPIEFRAWIGDENEPKGGQMLWPTMIDFKNKRITLNEVFTTAIENIKLMEFTDLLDKHGKKIWEGDILLTPGKFKMSVHIDSIGYGDSKFFNTGFDVCEVIGN